MYSDYVAARRFSKLVYLLSQDSINSLSTCAVLKWRWRRRELCIIVCRVLGACVQLSQFILETIEKIERL
jgi:hypothetical protein